MCQLRKPIDNISQLLFDPIEWFRVVAGRRGRIRDTGISMSSGLEPISSNCLRRASSSNCPSPIRSRLREEVLKHRVTDTASGQMKLRLAWKTAVSGRDEVQALHRRHDTKKEAYWQIFGVN